MIRNCGQLSVVDMFGLLVMDSSSDVDESETSVRTRFLRVPSGWLFVFLFDILIVFEFINHAPTHHRVLQGDMLMRITCRQSCQEYMVDILRQ